MQEQSRLKVLDVFSGIGGFSLGLERAGMKTVAFCEINPFCRKVLRKHWPDVPIHSDIRRLDYDGPVDVICGGYPCQPFSVAGQRRGEADDRYLWPAMLGLIKKHRPRWVIGENVAGHLSMGLDQVLSDLERQEYASRAFIVPACAVGAPHRRERIWIVGNDRRSRVERYRKKSLSRQPKLPRFEDGREFAQVFSRCDLHTPRLCGAGDGVPDRMDRLRALGNAVVPQIPEVIGRAIIAAEPMH